MSETKDEPDTVEAPIATQLEMPLVIDKNEKKPSPDELKPITEREIDPKDPNYAIKRKIQERERRGQTPPKHWSDD